MTIAESRYNKFLKRGFDGCLADSHGDIQAGFSNQDVPFGKFVFKVNSTNPNLLQLPDPTTPINVSAGIAIFRQAIDDTVIFTPPSATAFPAGSTIQYITTGRVMVVPEDTPVIGSPVFYRAVQLAPGGQDKFDLWRFATTPDGGAIQLGVTEGNTTFTAGVLPAGFTAAQLQALINAAPTLPLAPQVVVTGDFRQGFTIDWGPDSESVNYALDFLTNGLTRNGFPVSLSYVNLLPGFPSGNRFGVGSFRTTDDGGSCKDANAAGAFRRLSWFQGADRDGIAILNIS